MKSQAQLHFMQDNHHMPISGLPGLLSVRPECVYFFTVIVQRERERKKSLLAAMQPRDFLMTIYGQAVDSFSWFFCPLDRLKGGPVGLACLWRRTAAMWAQGVCVCVHMQCAIPFASACRMASRLTHCKKKKSGRSDSPWFNAVLFFKSLSVTLKNFLCRLTNAHFLKRYLQGVFFLFVETLKNFTPLWWEVLFHVSWICVEHQQVFEPERFWAVGRGSRPTFAT